MPNNQNDARPWVSAIKEGRFQDVERDFQKLASDAYVQADLINELQEINESNEYSKYVAVDVQNAVQRDYNEGKIQSPRDLKASYSRAMAQATAEFKRQIRPGYQKDSWNVYDVPDQSVRDYVAERRAQQAHLKEESRKIPGLISGRR